MSGLEQLIDTSYGPFPVDTTRERADAFVAAIGGDPGHDVDRVHPMYANAALFAAAPALLDDERVRPFTTSLIHSEQSFQWHRVVEVGTPISVEGTVAAVRARGPLNLVTFSLEATTSDGIWMTGSSVFLMSNQAAAGADDGGEPDENDRPPVDTPGPGDLPDVGAEIDPVRCGASRTDLRRYADASGDSNPIHYDHDAARRAGLEGTIVHGLLMAAWVGRAAGRYGSLSSMKLRFRSPLRPAVPAVVTGTVAASDVDTAEFDLALTSGETRLVAARVAVTR